MKIIEKMKLKNGKEVIIRYSEKKDVKNLLNLYNKVIRETEFLAMITPYTLAKEKKWFDGLLAKVKKKEAVHIVVEYDGKIVGGTTIEKKHEEVQRHVGTFGIAILQEFTGMGIGKRLMELVEADARKIGIEIMFLSVYGKNKIAQSLYRKTGFVEVGRIPNFIKRGQKYDTDIIMYKVLKS